MSKAQLSHGAGRAPPFDHHIMKNPQDEVAVTIHVYGGELYGCNTYTPLDGNRYRRQRKPLTYTA